MKILPIEGNRQKLDGGAMFGNVPKSVWKHLCTPDDQNRIELSCRAFLVQTDQGKNILFETGIGAFFEPKLRERYGIFETRHVLLDHLNELNIGEDDIDYVVLSHLHFDHAGGLLPPYGEERRLLFKNAKYLIGKRQWERAQNPPMRERASFIPELHTLLAESGRLMLIDGTSCDELSFVKFRFSDGHTIGLMLSEITIGDQLYVFVSDLIPAIPWIHLPFTMGYDRFAELVVDEKRMFYSDWIKQKAVLLFTHDHENLSAVLVLDEKGKYSAVSHKI